MKKTNFILLFFLLSFIKCFSQNYETFETTKFYQLIAPTFVIEDKSGSAILADSKLIFTIIKSESNGEKIIQFWKWDSTKDNNIPKIEKYNYVDVNKKKDNVISTEISNLKIFKISKEDFESNAIPYFNAGIQKGALDWSSGIVVLPLKARKSPEFSYSKDFTLGLSGGAKMRISHSNPTYLNFLYNIGISSVGIDSLSSKGKVKQPSDRAALTNAFGIVLENHSFQFGIFYGFDRLSSNDYKNTQWIYNRKPWISIGIGYQIFSKDNKSKKTQEGNN